MTVPSDSCPSTEACLLRRSALSLPLMSLCPLTQFMVVSSCCFSRVSRAVWILAAMCDLGPWVPESRFSVALIAGLQSERMASMPVSLWASMWVTLVPRYFPPDRSSGLRCLSGLVGFEQKAPAALSSQQAATTVNHTRNLSDVCLWLVNSTLALRFVDKYQRPYFYITSVRTQCAYILY